MNINKQFILILLSMAIIFSGCSGTQTAIDNDADSEFESETLSGCCMPACQLSKAANCNGEWHEQVACEVFDECEKKCCVPHCQDDLVGHCRSTGGTPDDRSCKDIPECMVGCCSPFCKEMTAADCDMQKGNFYPGSCEQDPTCEVGCCMPFCAEFTIDQCSKERGYDGNWHKGKCDQFAECKKVCCLPNGEMMTPLECSQFNGKEADEIYCSGNSKIKIEITTVHSCSCKEREPESDSCTVKNDIVQTYTGSFIPDPEGESKNTRIYDGETYYFKGYVTNSMKGSSHELTTDQGERQCNTFPVTYIPFSTSEDDYYIYSQSLSEEVIMTVTKKDDETYYVNLGSTYPEYTARRGFKRIVSGATCLGDKVNTDTDEGEDLIDMISGSMISEFTVDTLSGTKIVVGEEGYIVNMMRCDEGEDTAMTITWDLKLK